MADSFEFWSLMLLLSVSMSTAILYGTHKILGNGKSETGEKNVH